MAHATGLLLAATVLASSAWLGSCQLPPPKKSSMFIEGVEFLADDYRPEVLQTNMQEFTVVFAGSVEKAADYIRDNTDDPAIRRRALRWKIEVVPEGQLAGLRLEPSAALLDMWALCVQMDEFLRTGAGAEFFGENQPVALATSERLRAQITEIAREMTAPDRWRATEDRLLAWCSENPVETLSVSRESYLVQFAEHSKRTQDIFGSLGSLEEIAVAGEQNVSIYVSSLPEQVRWQAELVTHDLLNDPRIGRVFEAAAVAEDVPELLDGVMAEARSIARTEVDTVTYSIATEREIVLADVERQRLETIAVLREELDATRALLTAEREAATKDADESLMRAVQAFDQPFVRVADHVLTRLFVAGAVVLVVLFGASLVRGSRKE